MIAVQILIASETKQSRFWDRFVGKRNNNILLAMTDENRISKYIYRRYNCSNSDTNGYYNKQREGFMDRFLKYLSIAVFIAVIALAYSQNADAASAQEIDN